MRHMLQVRLRLVPCAGARHMPAVQGQVAEGASTGHGAAPPALQVPLVRQHQPAGRVLPLQSVALQRVQRGAAGPGVHQLPGSTRAAKWHAGHFASH